MHYYANGVAETDEDEGLGAPPKCSVLERRVRGVCEPKPAQAITRLVQQAANRPSSPAAQRVLTAATAAGIPIPQPKLPAPRGAGRPGPGEAQRPGQRCPPGQQWTVRPGTRPPVRACLTREELQAARLQVKTERKEVQAAKTAARKARTKGGRLVDEKDVGKASAIEASKPALQAKLLGLAKQVITKITGKRGKPSKREKKALDKAQRIVASGGSLKGLGSFGQLPIIGYRGNGLGQEEGSSSGTTAALQAIIAQMATSNVTKLPRQCEGGRNPHRPICIYANMALESRAIMAALLQVIIDLEAKIDEMQAAANATVDQCPAGYQFDDNGDCVPTGTGGGVTGCPAGFTIDPNTGQCVPVGQVMPPDYGGFDPTYGGGGGAMPPGSTYAGEDSFYVEQGPVATPGMAPPTTMIPGGGTVAPTYVDEGDVVMDEGQLPTPRSYAASRPRGPATGLPVVPLDEGAETGEAYREEYQEEPGERESSYSVIDSGKEDEGEYSYSSGGEWATEEALVE